MIDYDALRAIAAVIELQSFEGAAKALSITQSAVSQRIHGFESYIAERLLVRKVPYKATTEGEKYLSLLRKVNSLEDELQDWKDQKPTVKIAVNRDSLDLFFLDVLSDASVADSMVLEVLADDQENTLSYLKNGQADMCISSQERSISNHSSTYLGTMTYILACSKSFYKKYFKGGVNAESLIRSPLIVFDYKDKIQFDFLKHHFGLSTFTKINKIPTVASFKRGLLGGFGYGLIPLLDVQPEIKNKKIVNMTPQLTYSLPLYLHQWEYQRPHIKNFSNRILKASKNII